MGEMYKCNSTGKQSDLLDCMGAILKAEREKVNRFVVP